MKPFMQGLDVVAQSQSQYDRTCTLAIALLQKLSSSASTHKHCQALIVCSDKVSPQTVYNDFQSWFDAAPGLEAVLLSSDKEAARVVLSDPNQAKQVVLGTLGPLMEALRGDLLNLGDVKTVVISMHSDELVKFDAFKELLGLLPQGAQLVLMTGRITPPIQLIKTQNFRSNTAVRRADELTLQWSEHYFIDIPLSDQGTLQRQHHQKTNHHRDENEKKIETEPSSKDHKWDVLMEILTKNPDISHTVILTLTYSQTEALTSKLKAQQFNVVSVVSLFLTCAECCNHGERI
jgi:superfamily II DNA/RNA helicase